MQVVEGGPLGLLGLGLSQEEGSVSDGRPVSARLCKTEPSFTKNIESYLSSRADRCCFLIVISEELALFMIIHLQKTSIMP